MKLQCSNLFIYCQNFKIALVKSIRRAVQIRVVQGLAVGEAGWENRKIMAPIATTPKYIVLNIVYTIYLE